MYNFSFVTNILLQIARQTYIELQLPHRSATKRIDVVI